jgi:hypothetical protein
MHMNRIRHIKKSVYDKELRPIVLNIITNGINEHKRVIFLCGASKDDTYKLRHRFSLILQDEPRYELTYPEDLFEDLLEGQGDNSLLSLEEELADSVDLIILLPESPGSFAELGAFSTQQFLAEKTIVFRDEKYKSSKSFINHGPIRLIKLYKGKVIDIPYDFSLTDHATVSYIKDEISERLGTRRRMKRIDNILAYPAQILLLIFLFDFIDNETIEYLMSDIHSKKTSKMTKLAYKSATHSLIKKGFIEHIDGIYKITHDGYTFVGNKFYSFQSIMSLRAKILNYQYARQ